MVYIKYSRTDTDKSAELQNTVSKLLESNKKVFVIVPEQLSLQREFSLGSDFGEKVCVLSFSRLCNEIFRVYGGGAKTLPDTTMVCAAVYKALENTAATLKYYKGMSSNVGFVRKLTSVFSEFETNRMTNEAIMSLPEKELSPLVKNKYSDLFTIFDEYKKIWAQDFTAPGDDIIYASGILELNPFFEDSAVIFDGFYGFTPSQLVMIEQIISSAAVCNFYFVADMSDSLFLPVTNEIEKISALCKKLDVAVFKQSLDACDKRIRGKMPQFIEKYGFSDKQAPDAPEKDGSLTIYSAKNLSEELSYIACKIKNDVLSGKYRYSDIAILAPNPDEIATALTAIFDAHNVPVFADVKRPLISKPLTAFVLCAVETVTDGFEFENIFSFVKTGLTGISFDDISMLENYVRMWKIRDKGWKNGDWTQNPSGLTSEFSESDKQRLLHLNQLRERIYTPLSKLASALKSSKTVRDMLCAVYDLLCDFDVQTNLENIANEFMRAGSLGLADEYLRIYDLFIDMLESIDAVRADDKLSVRSFCDLISVCAFGVNISGRPARIDEVVFAGIGLVREENVKCVYIPCLTEDVIPKPFASTSLITESEKRLFQAHGIPVSMDFVSKSLRERFDLYVAMSLPTDELVLSASEFTITGEVKHKSSYLKDIISVTKCDPIEKKDLGHKFYLVSTAAASELASDIGDSRIAEAICEVTGFLPILEQTDTPKLEQSIINGMYSKHLRLSFSGIEEFVGCPFKFFLHRGLRIGKNEPVELNPANMGTFIHAGLERLLCGDYDIKNINAQKLREIINTISDDYYNSDLRDCKDRSKRFDYLFSRAKYAFENAAQNVVYEIQNSDFTPFDFEIDISKYVKPVSIGEGTTLSLVGSIDRVDMADTEDGRYARIIDYKSGSQKFSLEKIYNGLSMQLPIYAGAVKSKYGDVKFAAMYYLKVGVPTFDLKDKGGMSEQTFREKLFSYYTRDGLFCGDGEIMPGLDNSGDILAKVKKTSIITSEDMSRLVSYTSEKVEKIGIQIMSGDIEISPICDGDVDVCKYCDYKDICKIEKSPDKKRALYEFPENFFDMEENTDAINA